MLTVEELRKLHDAAQLLIANLDAISLANAETDEPFECATAREGEYGESLADIALMIQHVTGNVALAGGQQPV